MINLSQSDNNIERLKISHYLIGKILVWVLEAMTSPFMQEKFLDDLLKQEEMLVLFSDLSCICNKHLDISKESSIINPDDITKTRELLEEIKNKHMNMQFSIEVAGPGKLRNISIFSAVEDEEPLSGNTKVCSR